MELSDYPYLKVSTIAQRYSSPGVMEQAYAIFANVIELSVDGTPTNEKYAEHRATQYIHSCCDPIYVVDPPFDIWELEFAMLASRVAQMFNGVIAFGGHVRSFTDDPVLFMEGHYEDKDEDYFTPALPISG